MSKHYEFLDDEIIYITLSGDPITDDDPTPIPTPALVIGDPFDAAGVITGTREGLLATLDRLRKLVEFLPEDDDFGDKAIEAAITAMLWANTFDADGGEPLEHPSGEFEGSARHQELRALVTEEAVDALREDVLNFLSGRLNDIRDLDPGQVGHDFILTRNRHGAGFWDRGLGEKGDRLTETAQAFGEITWFQAEDGAPIGVL